MSQAIEFDAIIVGAGQAGMPLATELASAGWQTAIIERRYVGGTCINFGCTPTKTMVASARLAYLARRAGDFGVQTGDVKVNLAQVRARKQSVVESFRSSNRQRLTGAEGLELIEGGARFTGPKRLRVDLKEGGARELTARVVVLNTGARPRRPDLDGLDGIEPLTSTTIMELDDLPDHLLILGGGYVGVEFGQMFRRFGSDVTLVQRSDQLLTREDPDVAQAVQEILKEDGVELLLGTEATEARPGDGGGVELDVEEPGGLRTLTGTHLLTAVGRVPNSEDLNLSVAGVETNARGYVEVDDQLRTSAEGIYAVGDLKGGPAFTHISYDDYRILAANLLNDEERSVSDRPVPYVVFIDPQLGRIGLTEEQAKERGRDVKVTSIPMDYVSRAIEVGETRGMMKAVVEADSGRILGCAILGIEGGELMSAVQLAMMGDLRASQLQEAIFAHPTLAESFNTLFALPADS